MFAPRTLRGIAATAATMALAVGGSLPCAAAALPAADSVFILQGASPDAWAPEILSRIDPWATGGELGRRINANYYRCPSGCAVSEIPYPRTAGPVFGPFVPFADESIAIGVDLTRQAINDAEGQIVISGLSLGAITADALQRDLDTDPQRPPAPSVTFIVAGDPSRVTPLSTGIGAYFPVGVRIPVLGWTVTRPSSESPYNTVVVVGEYDPSADFLDRPWNLLALVNSVFGFEYAHGVSSLSSPDQVPPQNITMTTNAQGGTTTTYLMPNPVLPILRPLSGVLPAPVIDAANSVLKPIVDRAYSRNDAVTGNRLPYLQPTDGLPRLVFPDQGALTTGAPDHPKPVGTLDVPTVPDSPPAARDTAAPRTEPRNSRWTPPTAPARAPESGSTLSPKLKPPKQIRDKSSTRMRPDTVRARTVNRSR